PLLRVLPYTTLFRSETSIPGIYAAGDCTVWPYKGRHIHVEHWGHAVNHGKVVAKNMVEYQSVSYDRIPYFWSDQYNNRIQYVGQDRKSTRLNSSHVS